jgi:hypothetical protein
MNDPINTSGVATPNDPKLSDGPSMNSNEKLASPRPVRCSAALGVADSERITPLGDMVLSNLALGGMVPSDLVEEVVERSSAMRDPANMAFAVGVKQRPVPNHCPPLLFSVDIS